MKPGSLSINFRTVSAKELEYSAEIHHYHRNRFMGTGVNMGKNAEMMDDKKGKITKTVNRKGNMNMEEKETTTFLKMLK